MLRTGIETIICLSPNFLYVYVYVYVQYAAVFGVLISLQHAFTHAPDVCGKK